MTERTPQRTLNLVSGQFVHLHHPQGQVLRADAGTVWITIDGQAQDIVLDAGQSHHFSDEAPALLGSLDGAALARLTLSRTPSTHAAVESESWLAAQVERWLFPSERSQSTSMSTSMSTCMSTTTSTSMTKGMTLAQRR